jgi:hypothetical protein
MLLNQNEVNEVIENRYHIDAMEMILVRRGNPDDFFRGAGYVRQTPEGNIEYTIYDQTRVPEIGQYLSSGLGVVIPDEQFYDLEIRDWKGRTWRGEQTLPATSGIGEEKGVVCRGSLDEIECYETSSFNDELWLFLPGEFNIPVNTGTGIVETKLEGEFHRFDPNIWLINSEDYQIVITKVSGGIEVKVTPVEIGLPEYFDMRLEESLWFTLALPIQWKLRESQRKGTCQFRIRSARSNFPSPRLKPPLQPSFNNHVDEIGEILTRYLRYVLPYNKPLYHPVSAIIRRTLRASAISIEAEALTLSVAIESIVRREFSELGKPKPVAISAMDSAIAHVDTWTGDEDMKRRVIKAINGWKGANAREILKQLVESGVILEQHHEAWNAIRHPIVHGRKSNISWDELRLQCDLTYMGLIRIIFKVLGYVGPYTDRALSGWPTVQQ